MNPEISKYPYFIVPAVREFTEATGEERSRLARRIAAAVGDESALRMILGIDPEEFASFYPDMTAPDPSTADTIDSFLNRFGSRNLPAATDTDELIPVQAVPYDIAALEEIPESTIPAGTGAEKSDTDLLLDSFLDSNPPAMSGEAEERNHSHSSCLSESLAKVMIKNGNYQKALEIITELSLNNPKKSIYFADQIRFLKKLIAYTSGS